MVDLLGSAPVMGRRDDLGVHVVEGLLGRQSELEAVGAALADPQCHGVILRGPSGVGKTRLAVECLGLAAGLGFSTLRVEATPTSQSVPLGALAPLLPSFGPDANPLAAARTALFDHRPADGRLLLLVDDVQWLDDASATLLHQAVDRGDAFGLLTVRDDDGLPAWVRALWAGGPLRQVAVGPLDDRDVARMVEDLLRGRVAPELSARFVDLAGGNPLTLHELVVGAEESGAIEPIEGVWVATGPLERSGRAVELVEARLARLDDRALEALSMVSLAAPLPVEWLSADQVVACSSLEASDLVEVRSDADRDELWVAHPLYAEVVRSGVGPLRRRSLLSALLDRSVGALRDDHDRMRVALWSIEVGRDLPDDELRAMARIAQATHRIDLVVRFLERIDVDRLEPDDRYLLLSRSYWLGDSARGDVLLEDMRRGATTDRERALVAVSDSYRLAAVGRVDDAISGLDAALGVVADAEAQAQIQQVQMLHRSGTWSPAHLVDRLAPVAEVAQGAASVSVGSVVGLALSLVGRTTDAIEVSSRAADLHRHLTRDDPDGALLPPLALTLMTNVVAHVAAGDFDSAFDVVDEVRAQSDRSTSRLLAALAALAGGYAELMSGRIDAAADSLRTASAGLGDSGAQVQPPWLLATALRAVAEAQLGRAADARSALDLVDGEPPSPLFGAVVDCARAWVASVEHRHRDVALPLVRCVDAGLADGSAFFATYAAWTAVRLGVVGRLPGAVRDLPSRVEGVLVGAWADGVVAGLDGDAAGLDAVGERFVELGASIDAAEAFAAASRLWSTDGRARAATASIRRARESLGDSDVRTPGLVLSDDAVPLTDREREVADLAADGLAAKEIAERLFISRRTVTNHLQHVYDKLGVSGRSELRTALGRG